MTGFLMTIINTANYIIRERRIKKAKFGILGPEGALGGQIYKIHCLSSLLLPSTKYK